MKNLFVCKTFYRAVIKRVWRNIQVDYQYPYGRFAGEGQVVFYSGIFKEIRLEETHPTGWDFVKKMSFSTPYRSECEKHNAFGAWVVVFQDLVGRHREKLEALDLELRFNGTAEQQDLLNDTVSSLNVKSLAIEQSWSFCWRSVLNLISCIPLSVSDLSLDFPAALDVQVRGGFAGQLKKLDIKEFNFQGEVAKEDIESFMDIISRLEKLSLSLNGLTCNEDKLLSDILPPGYVCDKLKRVEFNDFDLDDENLHFLLEKMPNLQELILDEVCFKLLDYATFFRKLDTLELNVIHFCFLGSEATLRELVQELTLMFPLSDLLIYDGTEELVRRWPPPPEETFNFAANMHQLRERYSVAVDDVHSGFKRKRT